MPIKIYSISGAPLPWRLLLGLAFKALDYEIVMLSASEREHKAPPFLELNPRGTVPVLVDGKTVMRDSLAAMAWLDRAYPDRPLFGQDAAEAAEIWQATMEIADYLRAACHAIIQPVFGGADHKTPELEQAAGTMASETSRLDAMLQGHSFLTGEQPTAADAAAFPEIRIVQRAVETKSGIMAELGFGDPSATFPEVAAWKNRVEALPGVQETFPPHWSS